MRLHPNFPYALYLVISEADCKEHSFLYVAEEAIKGGVDLVQLREKHSTLPAFIEKAKRLKEITDRYQVPLIINDLLPVAQAINAAGIHVGNNDLAPLQIRTQWKEANKLIGYSIEYLEQLDNQQSQAADYLGLSPVFNTATKTDTVTEWGLEGIRHIRQQTDKPLVAIGNMQLHNIPSVLLAGADCIAVVSAICAASHPGKAAEALKKTILL